jgi:hypothetical protein
MNRLNRSNIFKTVMFIIFIFLFISGCFLFINSKQDHIESYKILYTSFVNGLPKYQSKFSICTVIIHSLSIPFMGVFIGPLIILAYEIYLSFSIGYLFMGFYSLYGIKSLIFSLVYIILYCVLPLIISWYILKIELRFSFCFFKKYILKKTVNYNFYLNIKRIFIITIIYTLINLFIFFLGGHILKIIAFLL